MTADAKKRQKKLEKLAAKRKAKHHVLVREKSAGLPGRLMSAANQPILQCWVSDCLWSEGIGWVGLSRQISNGSVAFAVFLIDRHCLGVKDVYCDITSRFDYDTRIVQKMRSEYPVQEVSPPKARKLIEDAVAYARGLGLAPQADYQRGKLLFGEIDSAECTEEFEFGVNGKPTFVAGPFDTPRRCTQIVNTLRQSCGVGGFDFTMPVGPRMEAMAIDDDEDFGEE